MKIITIEIDNGDKFEELKRRSKSRSDAHLIAKALAVYQFLLDSKNQENIVLIKTAWGNREFRIS